VVRIYWSRPEVENAVDPRMARAELTATERAVDLARAGDLRVVVLEAKALSSTFAAHLDREAWALTRAVFDGDSSQGMESFAR
jgi:enoyl-CoA hydratase/carnithine racemase